MKTTNILTAFIMMMFVAAASASAADDQRGYRSLSTKADFESVLFELRNAIIDRGLVVDYEGHLQKMLERTSEAAESVTDVGSKTPYVNAMFLQFCSAKLTHEVVSANPRNIAICPYIVFIYELKLKPGEIIVGYRKPITGPSKISRKVLAKVEALMNDIIEDAVNRN